MLPISSKKIMTKEEEGLMHYALYATYRIENYYCDILKQRFIKCESQGFPPDGSRIGVQTVVLDPMAVDYAKYDVKKSISRFVADTYLKIKGDDPRYGVIVGMLMRTLKFEDAEDGGDKTYVTNF